MYWDCVRSFIWGILYIFVTFYFSESREGQGWIKVAERGLARGENTANTSRMESMWAAMGGESFM